MLLYTSSSSSSSSMSAFGNLTVQRQTVVRSTLERMFYVATNLGITVPWFDSDCAFFDISDIRFIIPKNHPAKAYGVSFILDLLMRFFKGEKAQQAYVTQLLSAVSHHKAQQGIFNNQYSYHTEIIFGNLPNATANLPVAAQQIVTVFHIIIVLTYCTSQHTPLESALFRFACAILRPFHVLLAPRTCKSTSTAKDNQSSKDMASIQSTFWHYFEHMPSERKALGVSVCCMMEGLADRACQTWKRKLSTTSGSRGGEDLVNSHSYIKADHEGNRKFQLQRSSATHSKKKKQRKLAPVVLLIPQRFVDQPGMSPVFDKLWGKSGDNGTDFCYFKMCGLWVICIPEQRSLKVLKDLPGREAAAAHKNHLRSILVNKPGVFWICGCHQDQHESNCPLGL